MDLFTDAKDNFVSFCDLTDGQDFLPDHTYGIQVLRGEVRGENLFLLVKLFEGDSYAGLLCQEMAIRSDEFKRFVRATYSMVCGCIVYVTTGSMVDIAGEARLKMQDGKFCVDWTTYEAEVSPIDELHKLYVQQIKSKQGEGVFPLA